MGSNDAPPPGDVPPPHGDGWGEDGGAGGGGSSTPWMIAAILLAVALVTGLLIWLVNATGDDSERIATPTSTAPSTVTQTTSSTRSTTPTTTTTRPPSAAERCTPGFVADQLGEGTTVRQCDDEFLLVTGESGETGLYTWRDEAWAFLAEPNSDVCREQLQQLGVPDRFRQVFQSCEATSSSTTSSSANTTTTTSSETATSSTDTATTSSGDQTTETAALGREEVPADDPDEVPEEVPVEAAAP